jgi:hypothetical protein
MAAPPERSVANGGYWQTYLKLPQFPGRIGPALPLSSYSFGFFPGSVILDFPGKTRSVQEQPVIGGGICGGICVSRCHARPEIRGLFIMNMNPSR